MPTLLTFRSITVGGLNGGVVTGEPFNETLGNLVGVEVILGVEETAGMEVKLLGPVKRGLWEVKVGKAVDLFSD